jgi:hypothetical protein
LPGRNVAPRRRCSPSKVYGASWSPTPRRRVAGRSHEVELPFRVLLCGASASRLGRSPPPWPSPFPADLRGVSARHRPPSLAGAGSSSPGLASSSEIQPLSPAHRAHAVSTSRGVPSLHRDINVKSPLGGRVPVPAYVPPAAFRTLSTASSSHTLPACFIRLPRPRFPLRGFSRWPARRARHPLVPSCVPGLRLRESCPSRSSSDRVDFRALFRPPIRCRAPAGLKLTATRSPPEVHAPSGFSSAHLGTVLTAPPLMTLSPASRSDSGGGSSTCRSMRDLLLCLQTISLFELPGHPFAACAPTGEARRIRRPCDRLMFAEYCSGRATHRREATSRIPRCRYHGDPSSPRSPPWIS